MDQDINNGHYVHYTYIKYNKYGCFQKKFKAYFYKVGN